MSLLPNLQYIYQGQELYQTLLDHRIVSNQLCSVINSKIVRSKEYSLSPYQFTLAFSEKIIIIDKLKQEQIDNIQHFQDSEDFKFYKQLWKEGFYIREGGKFGCDFLLYKELNQHATYQVYLKQEQHLISSLRIAEKTDKIPIIKYHEYIKQQDWFKLFEDYKVVQKDQKEEALMRSFKKK